MKISSTTRVLQNNFGLMGAIDIFAEAGYNALDLYQGDREFTDTLTTENLIEARKYAENKGLYFNQSHAPFASSFADADKTAKRFDEIVKAMQRASVLGVKNIIVHPCQHLEYADKGNPEKLFDMNMEFFSKLLPYCNELNINIAIENMWQPTGGIINHSTCSAPEEFIRYIDTLNNPRFVACLDIGHSALVRQDTAEFIEKLGHRLKALHVHDVDGNHDLHTLPYYGGINWQKVIKALKDINYQGEFTFEADVFMESLPRELMPDAAKFMLKVGKYLTSL